MSELIVTRSPLTRACFVHFYPAQSDRIHPVVIWFADWIRQDAAEHVADALPFADRDIDALRRQYLDESRKELWTRARDCGAAPRPVDPHRRRRAGADSLGHAPRVCRNPRSIFGSWAGACSGLTVTLRRCARYSFRGFDARFKLSRRGTAETGSYAMTGCS